MDILGGMFVAATRNREVKIVTEHPRALDIRTFGQFEVKRGGVLLTQDTNRSQKMWDLFKYLLTNRNRTVPPESLIEVLWPEEDFEEAKGALRTLVYRLRKVLSLDGELKGGITSVGGGYMFALCGDCFLDSAEFERLSAAGRISANTEALSAAVSLYLGDYLSDATYVEWAIAKRSYYRRMFIETVSELVSLFRKDGRLKEADQACEQALLIEPLDEHLNLKYLELLMLTGQYSRAQEHYTQFTARLYREMGIRPSPSLKNIYDMIKKRHGHNGNQETPDSRPSPGSEGALICAHDVFASLAELESRRGSRNGYGVFRAEFGFRGTTAIMQTQDEAMGLLIRTMRKGDALTAQPDGTVSILLANLNEEQITMVMSRLRANLAEWATERNLEVESEYRQL